MGQISLGGLLMGRSIKYVVADNIKKYRKEQGLSMTKLATICGWTSSDMIFNIENYKRGMNLATLEKIAEGLNVKVIDLVEDWED